MSEDRDETQGTTDTEQEPVSTAAFDERGAHNDLLRTTRQIGGQHAPHLNDSWLPTTRMAAQFRAEGVVHVTGLTLGKRLSASGAKAKSVLGLSLGNFLVSLYKEEDGIEATADLAELDRLNRRLDSSGTIVLQPQHFDPNKPHPLDTATADDVEKTFATLPKIAAESEVSEPVVKNHSQGVKRITVRLVTGKQGFVYEVGPIEKSLKEKLTNIRATRKVQVDENGHYLDENGKDWCTLNVFWDELDEKTRAKTSLSSLARRAKSDCQFLDALDREKRPNCKIYPVDELRKISIFTNEKVTGPDGLYHEKETGKQWGAFKRWLKIFRVSKRALDYGIEQSFGGIENMTKLKVLDATKKEVEMLERKDVEKALAYIFEAETLEVNNVHTEVEDVGGEIRESISVAMGELTDLIPFDRLKPDYMKAHLADDRTDAIERTSGAPIYMYSIQAATAKFHDRISDLLAAIERTDVNDEVHTTEGRYITLAKFLNECRSKNADIKNPRLFIAHTDQAKRIRRMNSQNELTYLYLESDLISLI